MPFWDLNPNCGTVYFDCIYGDFFYCAHTPVQFRYSLVTHARCAVTDLCFDLVVFYISFSWFQLLLLHIILLLFDKSVKIIHSVITHTVSLMSTSLILVSVPMWAVFPCPASLKCNFLPHLAKNYLCLSDSIVSANLLFSSPY